MTLNTVLWILQVLGPPATRPRCSSAQPRYRSLHHSSSIQ